MARSGRSSRVSIVCIQKGQINRVQPLLERVEAVQDDNKRSWLRTGGDARSPVTLLYANEGLKMHCRAPYSHGATSSFGIQTGRSHLP